MGHAARCHRTVKGRRVVLPGRAGDLLGHVNTYLVRGPWRKFRWSRAFKRARRLVGAGDAQAVSAVRLLAQGAHTFWARG